MNINTRYGIIEKGTGRVFAITKSNSITERLKLEKILKLLEDAYPDRWFFIDDVNANATLVGKIEEV